MAARGYIGRDIDPDRLPWTQVLRAAPIILLIVLGLVLVWKCSFTVKAHEQAVVLRFGKKLAIEGPGLHFMIPFVDSVVRLSTEEHSMRLPIAPRDVDSRLTKPGRPLASENDEALELTADLNAAVVEWTVQWRVKQPDRFLFSIDQRQIETTIDVAARSVMHRMIGDYSMDEILTSKREEVGTEALKATQKLLDSYDCGVIITGLQMQRVTPPEQVKASFDDVNAAIQRRDKLVNEANRERNQLIPQAQASADKMINEAKGYTDRRRAEAQGEIHALLAKYRAYQEAPDITRRRLYLEAMEEVFANSGTKTVIDADLRGLVPLLQLGNEPTPPAAPKKKETK